MEKHLHWGHRQRVKKRFLEEGLDAFADHQVLELLLFYCIPMKDTNELAHKMIDQFGSLANLFEARPEEICERCKVSENTAILISLIPKLAGRYYQGKKGNRPVLGNPKDAGEYIRTLFAGRTYEAFYVVSLDPQNRVNHATLVHEGTINEAPVYPRRIVETALHHKANTIIVAHNHPGGSLRPSRGDIDVTGKIRIATESIGIRVVDHIIVAGDQFFSFAENGLL